MEVKIVYTFCFIWCSEIEYLSFVYWPFMCLFWLSCSVLAHFWHMVLFISCRNNLLSNGLSLEITLWDCFELSSWQVPSASLAATGMLRIFLEDQCTSLIRGWRVEELIACKVIKNLSLKWNMLGGNALK